MASGSTSRRAWLVLAPAAALLGCSVRPVGEPPVPPELAPVVDVERLSATETTDGNLVLGGGEWAVATGVERLRIANVSSLEVGFDAAVAADGSFEVELPGRFRDTLRIRDVSTEVGAPAPVLVEARGRVREADAPHADCFGMPRTLSLPDTATGDSGEVAVEVANRCTTAFRIAEVALAAEPVFVLVEPASLEVPAGGTLLLVVRFAPSAPGDLESLVRVRFAGADGYWVIGLSGRAL